MPKISLCGDWRLYGRQMESETDIDIPALVPGCVHTDLLRQGKLQDLFWRDQAEQAQWVERCNWKYSREFFCETVFPKAQIVFEGLDTYCDVYLNGRWIGHAEDMFIEHVFDTRGALKTGVNTIEVYFYSPVLAVAGRRPRTAAFTSERLYTRRMQCTYGWDWAPRLVTCGIFRPVYIWLEAPQISPDDIYIYTIDTDVGHAETAAELTFREDSGEGRVVRTQIFDPAGGKIYENTFYCAEGFYKERISIANPQLWQPNGMGKQPLYLYRVQVNDTQPVDCRFGIRTAAVVQQADAVGSEAYDMCIGLQHTESGKEYDFNRDFSGFTLYVNNRPVWCRGANWVPCEPFPSAETPEKITRLLELAADAHVNMLRIWGGGIFEQEHFYRECDRLGILVTQDFLMACGEYPDDEPWFTEALWKEAEYIVKRLRNHPCLVWWSGDNENAIQYNDRSTGHPGRRAAHIAVAPALQRFDPQRPFFFSSPYGGDLYASKTRGTTHNTQFMEYLFRFFDTGEIQNYREYFKEYMARFIAEEPAMGAAPLYSLRKFMTDEDIFGGDMRMWRYHTKTSPFLPKELLDYTLIFAEKLLGRFRDGRDRLFKLNYIQYEWVRLTLEQYRRNRGFCSGVLYWMLDDCWPAASGWALLDYYGMPKAAYYAFSKGSGPVISSFDNREGRLCLFTVNDTYDAETVQLRLQRIGRDGLTLERYALSAQIPENCVLQLPDLPQRLFPAKGELLVCDTAYPGGSHRTFYREGTLPLMRCDNRLHLKISRGVVEVEADAYIHALALTGDAVFEDTYFSLLPGEKRTLTFQPADTPLSDITAEPYTFEEDIYEV